MPGPNRERFGKFRRFGDKAGKATGAAVFGGADVQWSWNELSKRGDYVCAAQACSIVASLTEKIARKERRSSIEEETWIGLHIIVRNSLDALNLLDLSFPIQTYFVNTASD